MKAMGYNKKIKILQEKFKNRNRIGQKNFRISNKGNRLNLNMTKIREE